MSKILKTESYQKGILISTSFNFLSKGILFFNSVLIANYFGAQEKTDVYFFIFSSINLLAYFFSALNVGVLIPESMRLREQVSKESAMAFLNKFFYYYFIIGLIVTTVVLIEPIGIFKIFSKFSEHTLAANSDLILIGVPLFILMLLTNYLTELLASYRFFSIPMIAQFINNSLVLLFLLGFHSTFDIKSVFIGLSLAYLINLMILIYLMLKRLQWKFSIRFIAIKSKVWFDIGFAQLGNFASLLGSFAPSYLFSAMPGIITSLNYGQKTANMPSDLISGQFNSIAGIRFNELFAAKNYTQVNVVFTETVKALFFLLIPISGFISLFSQEIIQILYVRGAFNQEIATISAFYLRYLILLIPFFGLMGIITRLMVSSQQIQLNFYVQLIINLIIILSVTLGVKWFGYKGFAWAMLLSTFFQLITTLIIVRLKFSFIKLLEIFKFTIILTIITSIILIINYFLSETFLKQFTIFIQLAISFSIFIALYLIVIYAINLRFELINQVYKKVGIKR